MVPGKSGCGTAATLDVRVRQRHAGTEEHLVGLLTHMSYLSSPLVYFVFNRPRHTRETFAVIRAQKPSRLFIVADGPREKHPEDVARCREVREIVDAIDWPCTVYRNYSDTNLGCRLRISGGLDWVFSQIDRAIILEDDCLASPDFFSFCDTLLETYMNNETVWVVNGNSYQPQHQRGDGSYYFSKYPDCWGWATWRRAWRHYQGELPFLEQWINSGNWETAFPLRAEQRYWSQKFSMVTRGKVDTWDYSWLACMNYGGGLAATPNANLVKNIGFDAEGTHTKECDQGCDHDLTSLGTIVHPLEVKADTEADEWYRRQFFSIPGGLRPRLIDWIAQQLNSMQDRHRRVINW